jgi:serine/threonine protein kinase
VAALAETPDEHSEDRNAPVQAVAAPARGPLASAGLRLGDRYRLERLLRGFGGSEPEPQLWVGVDELLNRKVGVDLIATGHPLAEQVARAARDAAAVADARFVQVLDAVQDEDLLYIITEWVPGAEQLQERLAVGPLSPARATAMVRDLAEAMVRAHEAEVAHGALNPATVLITATHQVKLRGLLVEATLVGDAPEELAPQERYAADVLALGQVWYAALTARWPGPTDEYGLTAAPSDGAQPYTPAQIRAAVPKQVDAAVCRALGLGTEERIGSVKELADVIRSLPRLRDDVAEATAVMPPRSRSARPTSPNLNDAVPGPNGGSWSPRTTTVDGRTPAWRRRGVLAAAGCAVVALGTLAAFQFIGNSPNGQTTSGNVAGSTPRPSFGGTVSIPAGSIGSPLQISDATVWDDDPSAASKAAAPAAYDPTSTTGWQTTTQWKSVSFTGSYTNGSGIGLIFDLGSQHAVDQVKFQVGTAGANVEVLTGGSGASGSPAWSSTSGPAGYTAQATKANVGTGETTVDFTQVSTQYVMILFTTLPYQEAVSATQTPAGYRDSLIDVQVYGA